MESLSFTGVTKRFRQGAASPVVAVNNLTLAIPAGQVTGLVGPAGAGKSTLLQLAAGRLRPTDGTVRVEGPVARIPRRLPWQMAVGGLLERAGHTVDRIPSLLTALGLGEVAGVPAALLDREAQWWLQLAVALVGAPEILLADDPPVEALTGRLRQWCKATGRTLLLATDQIGAASLACDQIYHLQAGRLVETPPAERVRRRPFPRFYEFRVRGHLSERWVRWFDGLAVTNLPDGDALIAGEIVDQGALHGVIAKVRDCGIPLLAVTPLGIKS